MSDTESFESVASSYDNYTWIGRDGVKRAIDRLKAAHDREIRDVSQQQYDRGFEDGRHSMDAEHRAVAMRLRGLRFDGGSHENLARIAYAIYPCATGWTCESADGLRDKLIDLMGGVSDGTAEPMTTDEFIEFIEEDTRRLKGDAAKVGDGNDTCDSQCRGACAADCGGDSGEQEEVGHGGAAHDCGADSRGGYRGLSIHLDGLVSYDVLDNERHKAICKLRKLSERGNVWGRELIVALGLPVNATNDDMCDRLIHLLGGDQPSGIDVLREMDAESDTDGTCPNDGPTSSITDELRECVDTATKMYEDVQWYELDESEEADHTVCHVTEGELLRIADRIDAQFDRICQQHENVLQSTIEHMVDENLTVKDERDHWKREASELRAKIAIIREAVDG